MGVIISILSVLFFLLCVLLVVLILLQSDKSAGMGILGGSSQSAFGSSTADVITKATGVMIGLFMLGSLGLAGLNSNQTDSLKKELLKTPGRAGAKKVADKKVTDDKIKKEESLPKKK